MLGIYSYAVTLTFLMIYLLFGDQARHLCLLERWNAGLKVQDSKRCIPTCNHNIFRFCDIYFKRFLSQRLQITILHMGLLSVSLSTNIIEDPFSILLFIYTQVLGLNHNKSVSTADTIELDKPSSYELNIPVVTSTSDHAALWYE